MISWVAFEDNFAQRPRGKLDMYVANFRFFSRRFCTQHSVVPAQSPHRLSALGGGCAVALEEGERSRGRHRARGRSVNIHRTWQTACGKAAGGQAGSAMLLQAALRPTRTVRPIPALPNSRTPTIQDYLPQRIPRMSDGGLTACGTSL